MRDLRQYQDAYACLPFEQVQLRFRRRKVLEVLDKYRPRSILEVGCGFEPLFLHYTSFDMFTVVEPANDFFRNARELAKCDDRITMIHGTLEDCVDTLAERSYDFIVLTSLLHEVRDDIGLLVAARRLCAGQTVLHINVPNARSFHRMLAFEMGLVQSVYETSQTQVRMQQSRIFDIERLAKLVVQQGFRIIERGTFFVKPFTHRQMASLLECGFLSEAMLDGFYRLSGQFPEHGSEIFMNLMTGE